MLRKFCLWGALLLAGCTATPEKSTDAVENAGVGGAHCVLMTSVPEEVDGKLNTYDAMARAAKYNAKPVSENMKQKIFSANPNLSPKDIIDNVLNNPAQGSELYNGIRVLDYAIMYAGAYLADSQQQADDLILQRSAQSLAVAAVKVQGDVWIANRKIREINRMLDQQNKDLLAFEAYYRTVGKLSEEEQSYRSSLDVAIRKLKETRESLIASTLEYRKLVKDKSESLELDGRRFYELDHFEASLSEELFEQAALAGRPEFKSAKAQSKGYSFASINRYLAYHYDEVERLKLNGYKANNELYANALEKQAARAASSLIDAIVVLRTQTKPEDTFAQQDKVLDELAAAIMIQNRLAFEAVGAATLDYELVLSKIKTLKKEINLLKNRSLNYAQKEQLLDKKIQLLNLEILEARVVADRAAAVVGLYFYAGYAPFECQLLNQRPAYIAKVLKEGLNTDRVKMLAKSWQEKAPVGSNVPEIEKWAIGENWLENVLENKVTEKKPVVVPDQRISSAKPKTKADAEPQKLVQPEGDYTPYTNPEFNKRKVMQLGSYVEPKNADLDWNILSNLYPELKKYKPKTEKSYVNGVLYYRLLIKSPSGGFMALCNKLRQDRVQCLLK